MRFLYFTVVTVCYQISVLNAILLGILCLALKQIGQLVLLSSRRFTGTRKQHQWCVVTIASAGSIACVMESGPYLLNLFHITKFHVCPYICIQLTLTLQTNVAAMRNICSFKWMGIFSTNVLLVAEKATRCVACVVNLLYVFVVLYLSRC